MLICAVRLDAVVVLVAIALALCLGLVVGWQLRGYREIGRRGNDINIVGQRPTRP